MNVSNLRYQLLPITQEDCLGRYRSGILSLWRKNLGVTWPGRLSWLYQKNPLGPAKTWIALEGRTGQVVGLASLYPRELCLGQRPVRAGGAIDISLEPSHRVFGPALALARTAAAQGCANGFELILAAPNQHALGVFRRAGYRRLGRMQRWVKVIRSRRLLQNYVKFPWLAAFPGRVLDGGLRLAGWLHYRPDSRRDWKAVEMQNADERFDALWAESAFRLSAGSVKTSAYLNWRYADNAMAAHAFYCILDQEKKRVRAFLVYTLCDGVATVLDMVTADVRACLDMLLTGFCGRMYEQGTSHVVLAHMGGEEFSAKLRQMHFWQCGQARECYIYTPVAQAVRFENIWQPGAWSLFEGDLDL